MTHSCLTAPPESEKTHTTDPPHLYTPPSSFNVQMAGSTTREAARGESNAEGAESNNARDTRQCGGSDDEDIAGNHHMDRSRSQSVGNDEQISRDEDGCIFDKAMENPTQKRSVDGDSIAGEVEEENDNGGRKVAQVKNKISTATRPLRSKKSATKLKVPRASKAKQSHISEEMEQEEADICRDRGLYEQPINIDAMFVSDFLPWKELAF